MYVAPSKSKRKPSVAVIGAGVMPDHVHMVVFLPPEMSVAKAIEQG